MFVHPLGKGLRQAVSQRLQHDVRIIVDIGFELRQMRLDAVACGHCKSANPVAIAANEIGKAHVRLAFTLGDLLAQERHADMRLGLFAIDNHIIAIAPTGPQTRNALCAQPFFVDDLVEHRIGIGKQAGRAFAHDFIGQYRWIIAMQFPCAEKRSPVDIVAQVGQVPFIIDMDTRLLRRGWLHAFVDFKGIGACFFQRGERLCRLASAGVTNMAIFGAGVGNKLVRHGVADQSASHPDSARGVEHMDDRTGINRLNPQGRVRFGRGCAAYHQRHRHARFFHFLGNGHHFVERRGDKARQPDHVGIMFDRRLQNCRPWNHDAKINNLEAITLQHNTNNVLADIMHVALHGRHDDLALALGARLFLRLNIREEMRDRLFHHARRFYHLRQEHAA